MVSEHPKVLKIAIVGGGMFPHDASVIRKFAPNVHLRGGLASAIALQSIPNVQATVYEKATILREVGAGISIGQNTWNVLELLGVADTLTSGHPTLTVLNLNGKTGEELHRIEKISSSSRQPIRTQRTKLQSALLSHVAPGTVQLGRGVSNVQDLGESGVRLTFVDGSTEIADLVIGADGIRSVVRDSAWPNYDLKFTGTTIWRTLLPWDDVKDLDPRFSTTAWWHGPTTHVYFSPVGEGLWEIASRAYQDPKTHSASKVSWGTPVANEVVESHFKNYLPQIREALHRVPNGGWREFAAFAGPELSELTTWNNKIVLVGDSSHALSGAFGSGAGFAMEDAWLLAQALKAHNNDLDAALPIFDKIRLPYYARMYAHLEAEAKNRSLRLSRLLAPKDDDLVRNKIIKASGPDGDMAWLYGNHIGRVWAESVAA